VAAEEALEYLQMMEYFWNQVLLDLDRKKEKQQQPNLNYGRNTYKKSRYD
jgi:hypothetical protein